MRFRKYETAEFTIDRARNRLWGNVRERGIELRSRGRSQQPNPSHRRDVEQWKIAVNQQPTTNKQAPTITLSVLALTKWSLKHGIENDERVGRRDRWAWLKRGSQSLRGHGGAKKASQLQMTEEREKPCLGILQPAIRG